MSVRSRIAAPPSTAIEVAKTYGTSVPEQFRQGEAASQMTPASPFSPGTPIGPYDGYDRQPRAFNYTTGYNISTRPRLHERVSFETLTGLVESYDIAQLAIWHRIDSIRSLEWKLVPLDDSVGDVSDAIDLGMAALRRPDRINSFETWLGKWLYDILAYDAGTLYRLRNRAGRCVGLAPVDGRTIAPLLDYWGNSPTAVSPGDPEPEAYVQYVNGLPWNWLTRSDLIYEPFRSVTNSPYGRAPLESIILNANTDLRFQVYFLQRFTEGNLPAAFASSPDSWSPDQIEQFQNYWDSFMYSDQSRKHQIRWMPGGSKIAWSNEKDFSDQFSMFMLRKSLAAYHVVPSDMGFTEDVNRSSGESQADVQHRIGDLPLIRFVHRIVSHFLIDDLRLPLRFTFDLGEEQDDRLSTAQSDDIYAKLGVVGVSELREMRFGKSEPGGKPVPRFIFSNRAGAIPLSALEDVAGPVDDETGAPAPGSELPHKEFAPIEGVVPVPPPHVPGLAEREYGPSALLEAPPQQPVAKEGEGAGITAETGVYSYDLEGRSEDEDAGQPVTVRVHLDGEDEAREAARTDAVKSELSAFRRFERTRRKSGEWRDFRFTAIDAVQAHNLNDSGRLAVRKAAGEIAVAGLAVLAADTGRVLMLQRALCDDDPAGGKFELPGGHIEGDETPRAGALREFQEETGLPFVDGEWTGTWTSANGIYQGFVYTIPREADLDIFARQIGSDPDGDVDGSETIAWWDPADIPGNPAVRSELLADIDAVMAALGCDADEPPDGAESVCPCGTPVIYDEMNGWQHADGSVSHDDGESVSDKMGAVAKAAGPPKGDPDDWSGIWARTHERRSKLLAKHERAVLAAWNELVAGLSPRTLVREFREDAGLVAKLADENRPWWKDRGRDAALAWLAALQQKKGWAALVAAIEAAIADGMAEGEADSLAVAADRQGVKGFPVAAAFTAAAQSLQGDPEVSQQAQDTAQGILEGAAAALAVTLADGAEKGASEAEAAAEVIATVTGPDVAPVKYGLADALWAAAGDGLTRLIGKLTGGTPSAPAAPTSPPPEAPEAGPAFINWVCEGGSPCATCQDNQGGSPYMVQDVPTYLAHPHCVIGSTRVAVVNLPVVPAQVVVGHALELAEGGVGPAGDGRPAAASAVAEAVGDSLRGVRAVTDRHYVGQVITIRTALGHELAATPNHPVATRRGWVPIAELAVGDYVLSSTGCEWMASAVDPDVDDIPPRIEDVAKSLPVVSGPVPTAAEDFHGDGAGSEVHVVRADRLLVEDAESGLAEHLREHQLGGRSVRPVGSAPLDGESTLGEVLRGLGLPADGGVGSLGVPGTLLRGRTGHADVSGLATATPLDADLEQPAADRTPVDSEGFCERLLALASGIAADEIVQVNRDVVSTHVYNLDTVEGWYIGNGIVTHNCQCALYLASDIPSSFVSAYLLD